MLRKCIKCGSEKTHTSRVRSGERTGGMWFRKPIRCRECKERFWVPNTNAYIAAASMLGVGGLLVGAIWLVITNNIDEYYGSMTDVAEEANVGAETGNRSPRPESRLLLLPQSTRTRGISQV